MKRRKLATAAAFLSVLLAAAVTAASVSAASSASHSAAGKPIKFGKNKAARNVGKASFVPGAVIKPALPTQASVTAGAKLSKNINRAIPGKVNRAVGKAPTGGQAPVPAAAGIPQATSLPITSAKYSGSALGLNSYTQATVGGYELVPPDQALAEGNGFVLEAVNNVFQIMDTNFGHAASAESMESFFAPAILATGITNLSDPKAYYDPDTRKWFVSELAYDTTGTALFLAVSTQPDPLAPWNIYVIDTSFDGYVCSPFCLPDQPLLGANKNAIFLSTNSFDLFGSAFNGAWMYIIDKTALALGSMFPNIVFGPLDNFGTNPTPEGFDDCGAGVFPNAFGPPFPYCWYSVQPATSPNMKYSLDQGGTEFAMSALDWWGSVDNRIALWAFTNTSSINTVSPVIFFQWATVGVENYGFPATDTPFFAPYAEQPSSGNTPFCDFFIGPFCTPGPVANNDDRMNEVKSVKPSNHSAYIWAGLNTKALVTDPIHHQHRRSAIAYFSVSPVWSGGALIGGHVNQQGYIANWNNDVIFPAIGVNIDGTAGAIVYTLTGNTNFPSVAVSRVSVHSRVGSIPVVLAGQGPEDDFCNASVLICGGPRWGDYSAAVGDSHTLYLATEYIQYPNCDDATYVIDPTCGGTRGPATNWGTGLVKVSA
ncbi:MAG TPA: hypothetical protein VFA44_07980 [Gaiellaceae bacterium]|nr:hypothetical protein [Gaiellaceae bacterium]